MKKPILFLFTSVCGLVFAGNPEVEGLSLSDKHTASNNIERTTPKENKNINHILLGVGVINRPDSIMNVYNPSGSFLIGYQTKISDCTIFQSVSGEIQISSSEYQMEGKDNFKFTRKSNRCILPRIMVTRYWNTDDNYRIFSGIGNHYLILNSYDCYPSWASCNYKHNHMIGTSLSSGVEIGSPSGAISMIRLNYDLGILSFWSSQHGDESDVWGQSPQSLSLSFIVGF